MDRARRRRQGTARATASGAVVALLLAALGLVIAPSATAAGGRTVSIDAPATVVAGVPFDVTVSALDARGRTADEYRGTVGFSTDDPLVRALPDRYTFTKADRGTHTFSVTLVGTGRHELAVRDVRRDRLHDVTRTTVASAGATLQGEVLAGFDPIEGAVVTVYDAVTGHVVGAGFADILGYFYSITDLPAGDIKVGAVKPDSLYEPDFANNQDTLAQADVFTLHPGQTLVQSWDAESFGPYLDLQPPD